MPIAVDNDQRRTAVVTVAADLIIEGGLNAVTFRNLAARLACSTTVISHYFRDKNDVLRETYRHIIAESVAMREKLLADQQPSMVRLLEEVLPVAAAQRRHWTVWLCFWTAALFEPGLLEEHRLGLAGTRERLRDRYLASGTGLEQAETQAQDICNALFGISTQALFDPVYWTAERQRSAFRRAVAHLLPI